ncbi:hypothetical protein GA0115260_107134 [Streptomyces sp. MnatMP-M27]|nr:hypothetical protein GA0115260_107134 [Streptomyces sp. MnatMP-M27]
MGVLGSMECGGEAFCVAVGCGGASGLGMQPHCQRMSGRGFSEALGDRETGLVGMVFVQVDGGGGVHCPCAQLTVSGLLAVDQRVGGESQTGAGVPEIVGEPC